MVNAMTNLVVQAVRKIGLPSWLPLRELSSRSGYADHTAAIRGRLQGCTQRTRLIRTQHAQQGRQRHRGLWRVTVVLVVGRFAPARYSSPVCASIVIAHGFCVVFRLRWLVTSCLCFSRGMVRVSIVGLRTCTASEVPPGENPTHRYLLPHFHN